MDSESMNLGSIPSPPAMILFVVILVGVAIALRVFLEGSFGDKLSNYRKRPSVLDRREMAFFVELKSKLPAGFHIFPKIRIIDFLETEHRLRSTIWAKHVDFLVVDSYFKPVMAIEINGKSHLSERRQKSDSFKIRAFESASLPLEVINVGDNFSEAVTKIILKLTNSR